MFSPSGNVTARLVLARMRARVVVVHAPAAAAENAAGRATAITAAPRPIGTRATAENRESEILLGKPCAAAIRPAAVAAAQARSIAKVRGLSTNEIFGQTAVFYRSDAVNSLPAA